jgi:hypothetical protein
VTNKRTRPLSAPAPDLADGLALDDVVVDDELLVDDATEAAERRAQFAQGVEALKVGSTSGFVGERILLFLGGVIAPLGLLVVLLGYWGASRTPYLFEQVPYLISGGLLGLGLVFLGSFFYFTHWITQLVKEHRTQSAAVLAALERLQEQIAEGQPRG